METTKQKITIPQAIIAAGFLIMLGIVFSNYDWKNKNKSLSEQVGVNKKEFTQCMENTNFQELIEKTSISAELAMKAVEPTDRGTPYSVIIGKNGIKNEIKGADNIDTVKKLIEEVKSGKVTKEYKGEIPEVTTEDHIIGSIDAPIVIVEYSDLECPFCKRFGATMKQVVEDYNGEVAWVYRHWIVHQGAVYKTGAAECVAKLKGNEAFWKYVDLVFGLMKTAEDETKEANKQL